MPESDDGAGDPFGRYAAGIAELLGDKDPVVRQRAAEALAVLGPAAAVECANTGTVLPSPATRAFWTI